MSVLQLALGELCAQVSNLRFRWKEERGAVLF